MPPHNPGFAWHGWHPVARRRMKTDLGGAAQTANSVHDTLWRLAGEYSFLVSETSRASVRAQLIHVLGRASVARPMHIMTRRVMAWELKQKHRLLGAIRMQLDLGFRASLSAEEIIDAARSGIVRIALHPQLPGFPVGVALALPSHALPRTRDELLHGHTSAETGSVGHAFVVPFAIATNPTGLGSGAALINALANDCDDLPSCPRLVTFSPLTGLRARVIRAVDEDTIGEQVRDELRFLLRSRRYPAQPPRLADAWLHREAQQLATSDDYAAGKFHRATGGTFLGVAPRADRDDCDAMWMRAYFDYTNG